MSTIPTPDQFREHLEPLNNETLEHLSQVSGIPFRTILNLRDGGSRDPKLSTAAALWPHLLLIAKARPQPAAA